MQQVMQVRPQISRDQETLYLSFNVDNEIVSIVRKYGMLVNNVHIHQLWGRFFLPALRLLSSDRGNPETTCFE